MQYFLLTLHIVLAWLGLAYASDSNFAPPYVLFSADHGSPEEQNKIIEVQTTLRLGQGMPGQGHGPSSWVSLWPGMETWGSDTTTGDLIQAIAVNTGNPNPLYCGSSIDGAKQWCIEAYTLVGNCLANNCNIVTSQNQAPYGPDVALDIHYVLDSSTNNVTQTIKVGEDTMEISTHSGPGRYLNFAIECFECWPTTIPAHSYTDTRFVLDRPDPNFKRFMSWNLATFSDPTSPDQGRTWVVDWTHMPDAWTPSAP